MLLTGLVLWSRMMARFPRCLGVNCLESVSTTVLDWARDPGAQRHAGPVVEATSAAMTHSHSNVTHILRTFGRRAVRTAYAAVLDARVLLQQPSPAFPHAQKLGLNRTGKPCTAVTHGTKRERAPSEDHSRFCCLGAAKVLQYTGGDADTHRCEHRTQPVVRLGERRRDAPRKL